MNNDDMIKHEEIEFPWLVFKINGKLYTVNSKTVTSIVMMPENITKVPNVPEYMLGLIHLRGSVIPLIDLRALFNMKSLKKEYNEFITMIDDRKKDHIRWVEEFEYSINNNEKFKLNTDPHECEFGKWYDSFNSDIEAVNFHLKKIDEPHKNIHKAAEDANNCSKNCDDCEREKCLKLVLEETKEKNMPYLLELLDEIKEIFKLHYKEMVVVLEHENVLIGIVADEVLSVENITPFEETEEIKKMCRDKFVKGVAKSNKTNEILLILDDEKIMNMTEMNDILD